MKLRWLRGDLVLAYLRVAPGMLKAFNGVVEKSGDKITVLFDNCPVICDDSWLRHRTRYPKADDAVTTMPDDYPLFLVTRQHLWPIGEAE